MKPATFIEKPPKFTAVQWDGSEDAVNWIIGLYRKGAFNGTDLNFVDALDRQRTITRGTWVVRNDITGAVSQFDDDEFRRRYEAA